MADTGTVQSKLMYVTARMALPPSGGRALLSRLHYLCLRDLFGDGLLVHELDKRPRNLLNGFRGFIDGIDRETEEAIVARARADRVGRVYLDGSNLGRLARTLRKRLPRIEILTFFHNVEALFFLGGLRERKSVHGLGVLLANYLSERKAVRRSHRLITLSRRDSDALARLYGRGGTDILPMAMEDQLSAEARLSRDGEAGEGDYALFVGGAFYANSAGIKWFCREVAPHVALRTCVVGRGLEAYRDELEQAGNVTVVGPVDRLDQWYAGAKVVIAPIFGGSGMKTKVAEALMHGKRIVGTREAFAGYDDIAPVAGWQCETREQFIAAFAEIEKLRLPRFDPALRSVYEEHFSYEAALAHLAKILSIQTDSTRKEY